MKMESRKPKPYGFYRKMSDDELVRYTHRQYGDITKSELEERDKGLYGALIKRKLTKKLKGRVYRSWDLENIEKEMQSIIGSLGHFPSQRELKDMSKGLADAIHRYSGSLHTLREKMGYVETSQKPFQYWMNKNNIIEECRKFLDKSNLNSLPGYRALVSMGYSSLAAAITKCYGWDELRKDLGLNTINRVKKDQWKDIDFVIDYAERIICKHGKLPGSKTLKKNGYSGFVIAVYKYHGGFTKFRELLRERQGHLPERQQLEDILSQYITGGNE